VAARSKNIVMQKIELHILAIANSENQPQSFVVILKEAKGKRKLPVVIGGFEAQAIALAVENIQPSRPMTHDLFKNTMESAGAELHEIIISDLSQGIFFATMVWELSTGSFVEVDARTSDALAMAVRYNCPIFVNAEILYEAGIEMENPFFSSPGQASGSQETTIEELQEKLDEALAQENYELAASIRDEIKRKLEQQ